MRPTPTQLALWSQDARDKVREAEASARLDGQTQSEPPKKVSKRTALEQRFAEDLVFHGIAGWIQQYHWHPTRRFRADFAWPELKLIVELEGGLFIPPASSKRCKVCGRGPVMGHNSVAGIMNDIDKANEAALVGVTMLRFTPKDVRSGKGIELVKTLLERLRKPVLTLSPSNP